MLVLLTEQKERHQQLSVHLLSHLFFHFVEDFENALTLCEEKDVGGVLLDCLTDLQRATLLCRELRLRYPDMPICAIVSADTVPNMPIDRIIRTEDENLLCEEALDFCRSLVFWQERVLSTHRLYMTETPADTRYFGYPLQLSPREHKILACLFYLAPKTVSAKDLLALTDPCGFQSLNSLTVQISNINKNAAKTVPEPLVVNHPKIGYTIRKGIL